MKKLLLTLVVVVCLVLGLGAVSTSAAISKGSCGDNVTYSFDTSTDVLTISGSGAMKDYTSSNTAPWFGSVKSVVIEDGVTSIGDYAFFWCSGLTSVTIPGSVTSIGDYAFYYCSNTLSSVIIPDSVTSIGDYAFYGCVRLTEALYLGNKENLTIGSNNTPLTNIICYLKDHCGDSVTYSLDMDTGVLTISGNGAMKDYTSSSSNTAPWYGGRNYIKSAIIEEGVTSIGEDAFYFCTNLTSVTIGESVASIGDYAFYNCVALTEINWNAKSVADFSSRNNVFDHAGQKGEGVKVTFGDNVEKIPAYCFVGYDAPIITSVVIGESVTSIGDYAFYSCSSLTSITIPDSVTSIGYHAFEGCSSLTGITIPEGVTHIGGYTFYGCSGLTSITIPDSVTSIWYNAFEGCSGLTSIIIPGSVRSIGDSAFYRCENITDVYYSGSEEEWNNISIYGGNEYLTEADIHYNYAAEDNENGEADGEISIGYELEGDVLAIKPGTVPENSVVSVLVITEGVVTVYRYTKDSNKITLKTGADSVKMLVWESLESMKPLTEAIEIK